MRRRALMPRPNIIEDECSACGICVDECPEGVLEVAGDTVKVVAEDDCTGCEACLEACPMGAVEIDEA
jgi:ferredoxin